jgi:hypothetical protein
MTAYDNFPIVIGFIAVGAFPEGRPVEAGLVKFFAREGVFAAATPHIYFVLAHNHAGVLPVME